MNITSAEYFTFNAHNSALIVGQTASGKSYLVHEYLKRLEKAYQPGDMQYAIFDLKQVEFDPSYEDGAKQEYLLFDVITDSGIEGLQKLEELATLVTKRANNKKRHPFLFIYIEECDIAYVYQQRFDDAVIAINERAKDANVQLIYSTSRLGEETISKRLRDSFNLLLVGQLADKETAKFLEVEFIPSIQRFGFMVIERS